VSEKGKIAVFSFLNALVSRFSCVLSGKDAMAFNSTLDFPSESME